MPLGLVASRRSSRFEPIGAAIVALLLAVPAAATTTYTWSNSTGGSWSNPANWSPAGVPDVAGEGAVLPALGGAYTVTLDVSPTLDDLQIDSGDATLNINGRSIDAVAAVSNAGTLSGMRGILNYRILNESGGTILVAPGDSVIASGGTITNHGTIVVGPNLGTAVHLASSTTFAGSGELVLDSGRFSNPIGDVQFSIFLDNASGHTLRGRGLIDAPMTNRGLMKGEAGGMIQVNGVFTNYSVVEADQYGGIHINRPLVKNYGQLVGKGGTFKVMMPFDVGGTLDNGSTGTFVADGGDLTIACGTLINGTVHRVGDVGGVHMTTATAQNLTVASDGVLVVDGQLSAMAGNSSLLNNGLVRVTGEVLAGTGAGYNIYLAGTGVMELDGGTLTTAAAQGTLVNNAGHTIRGCGTIDATFVNNGTVEVDCNTGALWFNTKPKWNHGTIRAKRGTLGISWDGTLHNENKTIIIDPTAQLLIERGGTLENTGGTVMSHGLVLLGWHTTAKIVGGTMDGAGAALFRQRATTTFQDVTLGPGVVLQTENRAKTIATGALFRHLGVNRIQTGGEFQANAATSYLQENGSIELQGGRMVVPGGIEITGTLRGAGTIVGDVANSGEVIPDAGLASIQIQGDYQQAPDGILRIGLASTSSYGRLQVTGVASLEGTLDVAPTGSYAPGPGAEFEVLSFGSHAGSFAIETAPGLDLVPQYEDVALSLVHSGSVSVDPSTPTALEFYGRGAGFGLELPEAAEVAVRVFDVTGRQVAVLAEGSRPAGVHHFALRGGASGVYFARAIVTAGGRVESRTARLVRVR